MSIVNIFLSAAPAAAAAMFETLDNSARTDLLRHAYRIHDKEKIKECLAVWITHDKPYALQVAAFESITNACSLQEFKEIVQMGIKPTLNMVRAVIVSGNIELVKYLLSFPHIADTLASNNNLLLRTAIFGDDVFDDAIPNQQQIVDLLMENESVRERWENM
jgi:hypothetical protein